MWGSINPCIQFTIAPTCTSASYGNAKGVGDSTGVVAETATSLICSVDVWSDTVAFQGLQLKYCNNTVSEKIGGASGSKSTFTTTISDPIVQAILRSGDWIDQIQFRTANNVLSSAYGGTGGGGPYTVDLPGGLTGVMAYVAQSSYVGGRTGNVVALKFQYRCPTPPTTTVRKSTPRELK